jgi:hypothetical protein
MDKVSDAVPDIRGFALKVQGISGEAALGGQASSQDFLLINLPVFTVPTSDDFVALVEAASKGIFSLLLRFIKQSGFFGGLKGLAGLNRMLSRPFSGFATEPFFSVASLCCGPYACRVRLTPENGEKPSGKAKTPLEDIAHAWPEDNFLPVARLYLPPQTPDPSLFTTTEAAHFDPWGGLSAHRPLGDIMRARKETYFRSQNQRK